MNNFNSFVKNMGWAWASAMPSKFWHGHLVFSFLPHPQQLKLKLSLVGHGQPNGFKTDNFIFGVEVPTNCIVFRNLLFMVILIFVTRSPPDIVEHVPSTDLNFVSLLGLHPQEKTLIMYCENPSYGLFPIHFPGDVGHYNPPSLRLDPMYLLAHFQGCTLHSISLGSGLQWCTHKPWPIPVLLLLLSLCL